LETRLSNQSLALVLTA